MTNMEEIAKLSGGDLFEGVNMKTKKKPKTKAKKTTNKKKTSAKKKATKVGEVGKYAKKKSSKKKSSKKKSPTTRTNVMKLKKVTIDPYQDTLNREIKELLDAPKAPKYSISMTEEEIRKFIGLAWYSPFRIWKTEASVKEELYNSNARKYDQTYVKDLTGFKYVGMGRRYLACKDEMQHLVERLAETTIPTKFLNLFIVMANSLMCVDTDEGKEKELQTFEYIYALAMSKAIDQVNIKTPKGQEYTVQEMVADMKAAMNKSSDKSDEMRSTIDVLKEAFPTVITETVDGYQLGSLSTVLENRLKQDEDRPYSIVPAKSETEEVAGWADRSKGQRANFRDSDFDDDDDYDDDDYDDFDLDESDDDSDVDDELFLTGNTKQSNFGNMELPESTFDPDLFGKNAINTDFGYNPSISLDPVIDSPLADGEEVTQDY